SRRAEGQDRRSVPRGGGGRGDHRRVVQGRTRCGRRQPGHRAGVAGPPAVVPPDPGAAAVSAAGVVAVRLTDRVGYTGDGGTQETPMTTAWTITIDCGHPTNLANFWKLALGYVDAPPPVGFDSWREWLIACDVPEAEWGDGASLVDPEGVAPSLSLLRVPEGKHAKNRLHIDLQ